MVLVAMAGGLVWLGLAVFAPFTKMPRCIAVTASGQEFSLNLEQADNAALIAAVTTSRGLDERTVTIALATALQESSLRNINYGDRDSLGLFQQRPSQGWGTPAEIMNPIYATNTFLDRLVKIDGYRTLPLTEAAQRVQRSAFPDAYAKHEKRSQAFAGAFAGATQLSCYFTSTASTTSLTERVKADWHGAVQVTGSGAGATLAATAVSEQGLANYAVAIASATGIRTVTVGSQQWRPGWGDWRQVKEAAPAGAVLVTF